MNPGKISSLPHDIREQLHLRLRDNQPPQDILAWLNALPTVRSLLNHRFQGRPISGENLSEYKLRGPYGQWLASQQAFELTLSLSDPQSPQASLLPSLSPEILERWYIIDLLSDASEVQADPDPYSRSRRRHHLRRDISQFRRDKANDHRVVLESRRVELGQHQAEQRTEQAHEAWAKRPDVRAKLYRGLAPDTMALIDRDRGVAPTPPVPPPPDSNPNPPPRNP